ncbi:MAG: hypothetical protein ACO1OO_13005 [Flavisolibacter sp.]
MSKFVVVLCLAGFLFACKKNGIPNPGKAENATAGQNLLRTGKLLKREVSFTSTNPFDKKVNEYAYDDAGRCTQITVSRIDSSLAEPVTAVERVLNFNYSGDEIQPVSMTSPTLGLNGFNAIIYFKYDRLGRKIRDSAQFTTLWSEPGEVMVDVEYQDKRIFFTPVAGPGTRESLSYDTLIMKGQNIAEERSKRILGSASYVTTTYAYDNYVNPYRKINLFNCLFASNTTLGLRYSLNESKYVGLNTNNITYHEMGPQQVTYNYAYDADRYPVMVLKNYHFPSVSTLTTYLEYN